MHKKPTDAAPDEQILSLLPYAHMRGGFPVKPEDMGRAKGLAIEAMEGQVRDQLKQIFGQVETLARQARDIRIRAEISYRVYQCHLHFEPVINKTYYLYESRNGEPDLSLIAPEELGPLRKKHLGTVKLLADHTWEVIFANPEYFRGDHIDDWTQARTDH